MIRSVLTLGVISALTAGNSLAQGTVNAVADAVSDATVHLPWSEFKRIYQQQLQHDLQQQYEQAVTPVYSINSVDYQLQLNDAGAQGTLTLQGELLQGQPKPIPLFGADLIISQVLDMQGGTLISDVDGYKFHLEQAGPFRLVCHILVPLQQDERSPLVQFAIPAAVQNSLQLQPAQGFSVLESPGYQPPKQSSEKSLKKSGDAPEASIRSYFAPQSQLSIRFAPDNLAQAPVVDTFTKLEWSNNQYQATLFLHPRREVNQALILNFPAARWLSASVPSSWIERTHDQIRLKLPAGWRQAVQLEFELDGTQTKLHLPSIADNLGLQGRFQLITPESAQVSLAGEGLRQNLDSHALPKSLRDTAQISGNFAQLPDDQALTVKVEQFQTIAEPSVILDAVYQYTSVADNGTVLSVLRMDVPPLPNKQLRLTAVADAEIWSLTIDGEARSLYTQANQDWIIPLNKQTTQVELAYWHKTTALNLQGRLEIPTPALGLTAQAYYLAVGLPERVELVALEGELEPNTGQHWPKVSAFNGKPHYFSQPFYRGNAPDVAIHYREPITTSD